MMSPKPRADGPAPNNGIFSSPGVFRVRSNHTTRPASPRASAVVVATALLGGFLTIGGVSVGPKYKTPETPVAADASWKPARIAGQTAARRRQSVVEVVQRRGPRQAGRAGLSAEPPAADGRAEDRGGPGPVGPRPAARSGRRCSRLRQGRRPWASPRTRQQRRVRSQLRRFSGGFDAIWELDLWGKYSRNVEADAASMFASVADYDSALVSLTAEVARTYALIRTYEVLVDQPGRTSRSRKRGCGSPPRVSTPGLPRSST